MPCNSEHMNPTNKERYYQRTAQLLRYVVEKTHSIPPADDLLKAADDQYCQHDYTATLCAHIKGFAPHQMESVVYNARDPMSRKLADWWEEHQAADKNREEVERQLPARIADYDRIGFTFDQVLAGVSAHKDRFGVERTKQYVMTFDGVPLKVRDLKHNQFAIVLGRVWCDFAQAGIKNPLP